MIYYIDTFLSPPVVMEVNYDKQNQTLHLHRTGISSHDGCWIRFQRVRETQVQKRRMLSCRNKSVPDVPGAGSGGLSAGSGDLVSGSVSGGFMSGARSGRFVSGSVSGDLVSGACSGGFMSRACSGGLH